MRDLSFESFLDFIVENKKFKVDEKFADRGGDGIFGSALEKHLCIQENSSKTSDFSSFELKTKKNVSKNSKITLFNKGIRGVNWISEVDKFYFKKNYGTGYIDCNGRKNCHGLYTLIDQQKNSINIAEEKMQNRIIYSATKEQLEDGKNKIKNIAIVHGEILDGYGYVNRVVLFKNFSLEKLFQSIDVGSSFICSNVGSSGHDRGTQYRTTEKEMINLFEAREEYFW